MPKAATKAPISRVPSVSAEQRGVRPFLKWAGGKRQLLRQLRRFCPEAFATYFEPFIGSGALFFDLVARGVLQGRDAVLIDNNADLVGCYRVVRDDVEAVIRRLSKLADERARDPYAHYYEVRDRRFNATRARLREHHRAGAAANYTADLAAMLVYLNRTGFNGLFRQNAQGEFNVPIGRYVNPKICDEANLRRVAAALSATRTRIELGDFSLVLAEATAGDFVYFDPPYAPVSATSSFTAYTAARFGEAEQQHLQQVAVALAERGCHVLLSNSTAPIVERLYERDHAARRAGLRAYRVPARRAINSKAGGRGDVLEFVITNVPEHEAD